MVTEFQTIEEELSYVRDLLWRLHRVYDSDLNIREHLNLRQEMVHYLQLVFETDKNGQFVFDFAKEEDV